MADFDPQANAPFLDPEADDDEPVDNSKVAFALVLACTAAIAAFLFGWTLGFSGPALQPMENENNDASIKTPFKCTGWHADPKENNFGLCKTSETGDLFGSLVNIGCMIGALIGGALSDKLGRKTALMIASVPFAGGFAWMGAGGAVGSVLAARIVTGIAVGIASGQVPVYIAETAPPRLRGALGCINQLAITIGIFFVYTAGLGLQKNVQLTAVPDTIKGFIPQQHQQKFADWSWIAYIGAIIAGAFTLVCVTFLPETPKWLVQQGRTEEATKVLLKLRGEDYDIRGEIDAQEKAAAGEPEEAAGLADLMSPALRGPLFVGCTIMVLQQFTGINAVIFYSTEIFSDAGVDGATGSLIVMGTQVFITAVACLLVDKLGRVKLMTIAASGMILSSLAMALFYFLKENKDNEIDALAILAMVAYIIFFSLGMGAIPWLLMSEIFPARVRGIAGSVATCVNWTCSFILTESFTKMNAALGQAGTFLFFACELVVTVIFIQKYVPETKGKTLEQIEDFFNKK